MLNHPAALDIADPLAPRCALCWLDKDLHRRPLTRQEQSLVDALTRAQEEWWEWEGAVDDVLRWIRSGETPVWMEERLVARQAQRHARRKAARSG